MAPKMRRFNAKKKTPMTSVMLNAVLCVSISRPAPADVGVPAVGGVGGCDAGVAPSRPSDAMTFGGQSTPPEKMMDDISKLKFWFMEWCKVILIDKLNTVRAGRGSNPININNYILPLNSFNNIY